METKLLDVLGEYYAEISKPSIGFLADSDTGLHFLLNGYDITRKIKSPEQ